MNGFWVDCVIIGVQYALYGDLTVNMRLWGLCRLLSTFFFFFFLGLDYIFQFLVNLVWILWGGTNPSPQVVCSLWGRRTRTALFFASDVSNVLNLLPHWKNMCPHSYFISLSWTQECTTTSVVVEYIYIYIYIYSSSTLTVLKSNIKESPTDAIMFIYFILLWK